MKEYFENKVAVVTGGAPDFAITPEETAQGILMEYDLNNAKYGFLPKYGEKMDAHVLNVARQISCLLMRITSPVRHRPVC